MRINFGLIYRFLIYWLNAVGEHSLHPPFVYYLYSSVIKSNKQYYCFRQLEQARKEILKDEKVINIHDLGAGSKSSAKKQRQVKEIARSGLSSKKFSQLLFKLINLYQPETIIELGTSLGLNTLYLSSVSQEIKTYTFEGCPETANYANSLFNKLGKSNITLIIGNINKELPRFLQHHDKIDFVYFDANHSYEPTLFYFEKCLERIHDKSLFIFDDIHWSDEMSEAWRYIQKHPRVKMTIDIFDAGLVFFDPGLNSNNYILEF